MFRGRSDQRARDGGPSRRRWTGRWRMYQAASGWCRTYVRPSCCGSTRYRRCWRCGSRSRACCRPSSVVGKPGKEMSISDVRLTDTVGILIVPSPARGAIPTPGPVACGMSPAFAEGRCWALQSIRRKRCPSCVIVPSRLLSYAIGLLGCGALRVVLTYARTRRPTPARDRVRSRASY